MTGVDLSGFWCQQGLMRLALQIDQLEDGID